MGTKKENKVFHWWNYSENMLSIEKFIVQIGKWIFVHGGLTPQILQYSFDEMNEVFQIGEERKKKQKKYLKLCMMTMIMVYFGRENLVI